MKSKELDLLRKYFIDEQDADDILGLFLDKRLGEIRSLVQALSRSHLNLEQKKQLTMWFINFNKPGMEVNENLRELICSPDIHNNFDYDILKKLILYYVFDNSVYPIIKARNY